jgi:hypothetical protein
MRFGVWPWFVNWWLTSRSRRRPAVPSPPRKWERQLDEPFDLEALTACITQALLDSRPMVLQMERPVAEGPLTTADVQAWHTVLRDVYRYSGGGDVTCEVVVDEPQYKEVLFRCVDFPRDNVV